MDKECQTKTSGVGLREWEATLTIESHRLLWNSNANRHFHRGSWA